YKLSHRRLVIRVEVYPAGVHFGLSDGLQHVLLESLPKRLQLWRRKGGSPRPSPHHRLIEEVFVVRVGSRRAPLKAPVEPRPPPHAGAPFFGQFGNHIQPRPEVFAALGIVGRGGAKGTGPSFSPL